jgi:NADH:ubiquinone oxidoreductase subunit 5 (subunit L)/multisubunit Na+/H+ antiporter MnhA subunit
MAFLNSSSLVRWDPLTASLLIAVWTVGVTVGVYARRNLGRNARRSFGLGAGLILGGTSLLAVAGRPWLMACGWVLTSAAVLVVLARSGSRGPHIARRTALALIPGDVALVAGLAILTWDGNTETAAILLGVAALARAAQAPFPAWLPGTVDAPTPVSALLHAGVVNAGGFLLVRSGEVFAEAALARWMVGLFSFVTIVAAAHAARLRSDVKGALATSTSAQMGFMLLAVALGAPFAAMAHLVGHAWYKSARFLGAGGEVSRTVQIRRHARPVSSDAHRWVWGALAVGVPAVVLIGAHLVSEGALLHGADGWVLGAAMTVTAAHLCWGWAARQASPTTWWSAALAAAIVISVYLALVAALERWWDPAVATSGDGWPAAVVLALLGAALWATARLVAHPSSSRILLPRLRRYGRTQPVPATVPGTSPPPVRSESAARLEAVRT